MSNVKSASKLPSWATLMSGLNTSNNNNNKPRRKPMPMAKRYSTYKKNVAPPRPRLASLPYSAYAAAAVAAAMPRPLSATQFSQAPYANTVGRSAPFAQPPYAAQLPPFAPTRSRKGLVRRIIPAPEVVSQNVMPSEAPRSFVPWEKFGPRFRKTRRRR